MIKTLIVDDSATFRSIIRRVLSTNDAIDIVGTSKDGSHALSFILSKKPDVVTLDLEMPGLDGISLLQEIGKRKKDDPELDKIKIIVVSAGDSQSAKASINALKYGAYDVVLKATGSGFDENIQHLTEKLLPRILETKKSETNEIPSKNIHLKDKCVLSKHNFKALLIGSSTGGPQALMKVLPKFTREIKVPILIVQHMPPEFTQSLADSLNKLTSLTVKEAEKGEILKSGTVYIAPGNYHLEMSLVQGDLCATLNKKPPENFCRPAVDVLFRSAAQSIDGECLALILTGMGSDGCKGLQLLKDKNAYAIVQDEESSVVWGMPGNVVEAGLADNILPLDQIGNAVQDLLIRHQS